MADSKIRTMLTGALRLIQCNAMHDPEAPEIAMRLQELCGPQYLLPFKTDREVLEQLSQGLPCIAMQHESDTLELYAAPAVLYLMIGQLLLSHDEQECYALFTMDSYALLPCGDAQCCYIALKDGEYVTIRVGCEWGSRASLIFQEELSSEQLALSAKELLASLGRT